jgi:hypothetical protein
MKSLYAWVCIISVMLLEFQINSNSFLIFQTKSFDTCIETQISCIQVYPTKLTFVKTKLRENFSEFTGFFHKV